MAGIEVSKDQISFVIKEVPDVLKSSSVIEPDAALKPTQSNIGYFLSKQSAFEDDVYGVHKSQYSGIGSLKILDKNGEELTVARSHKHCRTGLHRNLEPIPGKQELARALKANEGLFAKDIGKIGPQLFMLSRSHVSKPLPKLAEKQLFPRSVMFELDYTKAVNKKAMLEALEKERAIFEQKLQEKKAGTKKAEEDKKTDPKSEEKNDSIKPKRDITNKLSKEKGTEDFCSKQTTKRMCASVCEPCGCVLTQGLCPNCCKTGEQKVFTVESETVPGWKGDCIKWPNEKPRYGSPWGEQRKAELLRVGYPFAKEAASWLYCVNKPLDCSLLYKPTKKKFPERAFSSLNI